MIYLLFLVLWLIFGSFGSVILQRMDKKITRPIIKWFLYGRSECPHCHHTLHRYNLIPLVSWIRQWWTCAYCKKPVSTIYPILELLSGMIFLLWSLLYRNDFSSGLLGGGVFVILVIRRLLVLLLVWDMYTYELHVPVRFTSMIIAILYGWILTVQWEVSRYLLTSPIAFFIVFFLIYRFGKRYSKIRFGQMQETFGQGDVMLAPLLWYLFALWHIGGGQVLSQHYITFLLFFVLGSCIVGLIYYSIVVLLQKVLKKLKFLTIHESTSSPMIPFLPAMIIMYWIVVIWFAL